MNIRKNTKQIVSTLLVGSLLVTNSYSSIFALQSSKNIAKQKDTIVEQQDSFEIIADENGELYIKDNSISPIYRIGGGIGRCTQSSKTFYRTMTRSQAKAALKAIQLGEGSVKSIGTLLASIGGAWGLAASLVLNYIGGEDTYVRYLKNFIESGKSTARFVFKTHCVNRGYMYGEPMYDYQVDSISISY